MLGRIFAILLIVLGLGTAGAGIASGTLWRPDEVVTATVPQAPETPVVLAGGHVLATVNSDVTVTVTAADDETPVMLAMGRAADVRAWVDDASALEITGLEDWETLSVEQVSGAESSETPSEDASGEGSETPSEDAESTESTESTESESAEGTEGEDTETADGEGSDAAGEMTTVPDPRGSDLWIEELSETGELTYEWSQVEGDWLMLVASDGSTPAPSVSLTWTREVTTPLMVPGIVVGGVLFLVGLVWLAIQLLMSREEKRARERAARAPDEDDSDATTVLPTVAEDGTPLTRRQLREAERAKADPQRRTPAPVPDGAPAAQESAPAEHADSGDVESSPGDGGADLAAWVHAGRKDQADEESGSSPGDEPDRADADGDADQANAGEKDTEPRGGTGVDEANAGDDDTAARAGTEAAPRRRWWQRRSARASEASTTPDATTHDSTSGDTEGARLGDFSTWGAPTIGAGDSSAPESADWPAQPRPTDVGPGAADEASDGDHNAQASGASWRQTWGLHRPPSADTPDDGDEEDKR
ncbi:hypothetical protein [Ruania halotolerans]|uniref:hypothetical protein n=1 Tax=Ruania halotolerans TaxID=2897773 RepID=UPI001E6367F8|nr:hypothetical protein [Ruania halotolerans]UFU07678.1 hypothetical protein LQF10_06130 [Ruania halotolerans]